MLLGLLLYLLHGQQALIGQTRSVSRLVQGAAALEAAEAGVAWTLAALNHAPGAADSVRQRLLDWTLDGQGSVQPRPSAAARACTQDAAAPAGWTCRWADSPPEPDLADGSGGHARSPPAWVMRLVPGPLAESVGARRNTLGLQVSGCSQTGVDCGAAPDALLDPDQPPDARRHLRLTLALLGDLVTPPAAALSAGGAVHLGPGSQVVMGEPGAAAVAIEAGGRVDLALDSRVVSAPGRPAGDAVLAEQAALIDPAPRWWHHFRASPELMRRLPSLHHLGCAATACGSGELAEAVSAGTRAVWVDGALQIDGGTWGSAERPLLLVVDGPVRLSGPVRFDGWLLAESLVWQVDATTGTPAGPDRGLWQGAISTWGDARLSGPLDLVHRPGTVARLRGTVGTWTALPGSWRDHAP
jgi:hypothetical protein